jgi:hypothetical protein
MDTRIKSRKVYNIKKKDIQKPNPVENKKILEIKNKKLENEIANEMLVKDNVISKSSNISTVVAIKIIKYDINNLNDLEIAKKTIINKFIQNVKGKEIIIEKSKHCGSEGHWLEKQMGLAHNSKNEPDILGYEMKKNSAKITFGDFSASEYLFSKKKENIVKYNNWKPDEHKISRNDFIKYFGTPNPLKNNRYSWSGSCVPKYGEWNSCGQKMIFNDTLDLYVFYSFENDKREVKSTYPKFMQNEILIAIWEKSKLEKNINAKFNNKGFFICKKLNDKYELICFGKPFDFNYFVENIKNKKIIFDSGMYRGNNRNYSQFRSNLGDFWNNLITEEYC